MFIQVGDGHTMTVLCAVLVTRFIDVSVLYFGVYVWTLEY